MNQIPLEKFLKNMKLLKKSCLKLKNKQLFFSNLMFLRNFYKGNWSIFESKYENFGSKISKSSKKWSFQKTYFQASSLLLRLCRAIFRFLTLHLDHFPLEKFLKKYRLLKKSCSKSKNKQLFFSNLYFLRNFSKGKWSK